MEICWRYLVKGVLTRYKLGNVIANSKNKLKKKKKIHVVDGDLYIGKAEKQCQFLAELLLFITVVI